MRSLLFLVAASTVCAQQAFEVISIKPNASTDDRVMIRTMPGGRYTATGIPVRLVLAQAFHIRDFQISGGPAWIASERYDIQAKAPEGTGERIPMEVLRQMLQNMLAERFQLKTHIETKEVPGYALVAVAKGGHRLKASDSPVDPARPPMMRIGRGLLSAEAIALPMLAQQLSQLLGRPVADRTGLNGFFQVHLEFAADPGQGSMGPAGELSPGDSNNGPSIFTALQEKLGLKLESIKAPVDILVIDSIARPAEN